jgi:hypothetical protein
VQGDTTTVLAARCWPTATSTSATSKPDCGQGTSGSPSGEINRRVAGTLADCISPPGARQPARESARRITSWSPEIRRSTPAAIAARPYDPSSGPLIGYLRGRITLVTAHRLRTLARLWRIFCVPSTGAVPGRRHHRLPRPQSHVREPGSGSWGRRTSSARTPRLPPMVHLLRRCTLGMTKFRRAPGGRSALGSRCSLSRQVTGSGAVRPGQPAWWERRRTASRPKSGVCSMIGGLCRNGPLSTPSATAMPSKSSALLTAPDDSGRTAA